LASRAAATSPKVRTADPQLGSSSPSSACERDTRNTFVFIGERGPADDRGELLEQRRRHHEVERAVESGVDDASGGLSTETSDEMSGVTSRMDREP
jgi:hypothetical protein